MVHSYELSYYSNLIKALDNIIYTISLEYMAILVNLDI